MKTFHLTISTPDGHIYSDEIVKFSARGAEGDFAIMAGHIPFMTTIMPGECAVELSDGNIKTGQIEAGLLTVTDGRVTLLSSSFHW